jgi:hypothetical protein
MRARGASAPGRRPLGPPGAPPGTPPPPPPPPSKALPPHPASRRAMQYAPLPQSPVLGTPPSPARPARPRRPARGGVRPRHPQQPRPCRLLKRTHPERMGWQRGGEGLELWAQAAAAAREVTRGPTARRRCLPAVGGRRSPAPRWARRVSLAAPGAARRRAARAPRPSGRRPPPPRHNREATLPRPPFQAPHPPDLRRRAPGFAALGSPLHARATGRPAGASATRDAPCASYGPTRPPPARRRRVPSPLAWRARGEPAPGDVKRSPGCLEQQADAAPREAPHRATRAHARPPRARCCTRSRRAHAAEPNARAGAVSPVRGATTA